MKFSRVMVILVLSIGSGYLFGTLLFPHQPARSRTAAQGAVISQGSRILPPAVRDNRASIWSGIDDRNLAVLRDNLLAIGCPRETIEDLLVARVDRLFLARERTATKITNVWQTIPPRRLSLTRTEEIKQRIELEKSTLLRELLDIDLSQYKSRHQYASTIPTNVKFDPNTDSLRLDLYGLNATQAEFDLIRDKYKTMWDELNKVSDPKERGGLWIKLKKLCDDEIKQGLGDERFAEYVKLRDFRYQELNTFVDEGYLSADIAQKTWQIIQEIDDLKRTKKRELIPLKAEQIREIVGKEQYLELMRVNRGIFE